MADYPDISTIGLLDPLTPAGNEVASKLDDALRQVKKFLQVYLAVSHNDDGTLKAGALTISALADGLVTYAKLQVASANVLLGTGAAVGVVQEVPCSAFSRGLLTGVDAAAWRTILGLAALSLKATVATGDVDAGAITTDRLADIAVTTPKIADASIVAAKIADGIVGVGKLAWGGGSDTVPRVMVRGTTGAEMVIGGVMSATVDLATTPPTLKFALASVPGPDGSGNASALYACLEEQSASGVDGGASVSGENIRGVAVPWVEAVDPSDIVGTSGSAVVVRKKGVYKLTAWVPGCNGVGKHQAYFGKVTAAGGTFTLLKTGSSSESTVGETGYSVINKVFEVTADGDLYEIRQYTQNAIAADGLGRASANGKAQVYTQVEIFKV